MIVIVASSTTHHHTLRDQTVDGSGYDKRSHSRPSIRGMCYCSRYLLHGLFRVREREGGREGRKEELLVGGARREAWGKEREGGR